MNSPKHMRQRWRLMRFGPRIPLRMSMLMSPRGCQEHQRTHEKAHSNGNAVIWRRSAEDLFQAGEPAPGRAYQRN